MKNRVIRFAIHLVVVGGLAAQACAEEGLETVLVTGQRLGLGLEQAADNGALGQRKLLDTPFSLTVVDDEEIARRQAASVSQIFINDPSVSSSSIGGMTNWWGAQIRGLGVRSFYVDDVPLLLTWGGEMPLEPVESVEALKGLAGFMYGFGSPGGVISYRTKKPTDTPLLVTELGLRNDNQFSGDVDIGGRLSDGQGLGYRVNLAGEFGDAYTSAGIERTLASLALDHRITDDLKWHATALYEDSKIKHEPLYFYWDNYVGDRLPTPTYDYGDVTVGNSWYKTQTLQGSTGLKWQFSDAWKADFTVGYSRKEHFSNKMFGDLLNEAGDYAGSAYNFAGILMNTFSQALVQGQMSTGAVRHDLVLGLGYQKSTSKWGNDWYWSNDFNGNLYQSQTFLVTRDIDFSLAPISEDQRQTALFASDTLHFGDHWQAIIGARYTDYDSRDVDGDPDVDSGYQTSALSPTYALIYKPVPNVSLYGSYVEALEQGGTVGETYANFGEVLDATVSKQIEVGAKYEKDRLSFTTALFRVERGAQIDQIRDGLRYLTQDGLTLYEGIEAISSFSATDTVRLGIGATYLDAKIEDVSPENAALEGNQPAGAGKLQVTANVEVRVPAVAGLSLHGNVRYFDDAFYEDLNRIVIPGRTLANVGFQYQTALSGQRVVFTGNINNLLNKKYWELNTLGEGINGALSMRVSW